jgi:tyrosyl-tRNA synthetase
MITIDEVLTRGVQNILPSKEGLAKLMESKKITLYQGFDPSMPSLHLGNFVGLMKLRQFQKLGHKVIFLVGDFTGMIGDPSDKLSTRPKLTREEVLKNCKTWKEQASKVLDFEGENKALIMFNSEWSDKISFKDLIEITSNFTVQQMIERDMFQKRLENKEPIYLHEFLYPVAQGYDSVVMDVDLEIGGNDQLFNMLAGRNLMQAMKKKEKYVLTTKLLVDKEGKKVGKTTGNALFLDKSSEDFFGGIMSFPDEVIPLAFELLTEVDIKDIEKLTKESPLKEKKHLAYEVVKLLWGESDAKKSQEKFEKSFQEKSPEFEEKIEVKDSLIETISQIKSIGSISQAKRLIKQGAVDIDGKTIKDINFKIKGNEKIKVGKKVFVKVIKE